MMMHIYKAKNEPAPGYLIKPSTVPHNLCLNFLLSFFENIHYLFTKHFNWSLYLIALISWKKKHETNSL